MSIVAYVYIYMCVYVGLDRYSSTQSGKRPPQKFWPIHLRTTHLALAGSWTQLEVMLCNITILYVLFKRYINVLWALEKLYSILSSKLASIDWANPQIVEMIDVVGDRLTWSRQPKVYYKCKQIGRRSRHRTLAKLVWEPRGGKRRNKAGH